MSSGVELRFITDGSMFVGEWSGGQGGDVGCNFLTKVVQLANSILLNIAEL